MNCSLKPAIGTDLSPARGLPLWDDCDAQVGEGVDIAPDWDLAAPAPDYEEVQRVNW
jgi:hypothetical protein